MKLQYYEKFIVTSSTNPSSTNPSSTNPSSTNPSSTNPSSTNPSSTNPSLTNPSSTNPSSTNPSSTNPKITNLHDSYKRLDKITRHGLLNQKDFIGTSNIYNPYIYYDASKNKSEEENNDDNIGKFNFDDYFV
jgi:hypothetical protein